MFDDPEFKQQAVLPLRSRPIVLWVGALTPLVLRAAIRLNASISTHGHRAGILTTIGFESLEPRLLPQQLLSRSSYRESKLVDFAKQAIPQELQQLVEAASLTPDELKRVKDALPKDAIISERGGRASVCPSSSVAYNRGTAEQSSEGWRYLGRGPAVVVCSSAWRIGETVLDAAVDGGKSESKSVLEFYEDGRWQGQAVSSDRLLKNPVGVLQETRSQLGFTPLGIARKFEKDLHYLALLLNPPPRPRLADRVGIDLADGLLRTNRCELSLQNGNLTPHDLLTDGKSFLPLADGTPPRRETVRRLLECPPARRLISSLVTQLYFAVSRRATVAVLNHGDMVPLADRFLQQTGLHDKNLAIPFETLSYKIPISNSHQIRRTTDSQSLWGVSGMDFAFWLAASRPVIFTTRRRNQFKFDFQDAELQRVVLALLAGIFRQEKEHKGREALQHSWDSLLADNRLTETEQERNADSACRAPKIITVRHAVGYWLSRGIKANWFECQRTKPEHCRPRTLWFAGDQRTVWVAKRGVNDLLENHRLPTWDLSKLFVSQSDDQLDCDVMRYNQMVYVEIPLDWLDAKAQQLLHGAPSTAEPQEFEIHPADQQFG
jgi:hypothetical protein